MTHTPKPKRRALVLALATTLATLLLIVANIVASTRVATTGQRLSELESQALSLERANSKLEREISLQRSFQSLEAYAKKTGLIPINQVLNLTSPEAIARAPVDSAPATFDVAQVPQE
ncbi:MAG: hypothetical protein HYS86_01300 [Candidatus Chisholmbacteria bacterium]|nr:hypothetical protein [Candidatus Chisholmbacteria bacterium]